MNRKLTVGVLSLLIFVIAVGVGITVAENDPAAELRKRAHDLQSDVVELRGLDFKREVAVGIKKKDVLKRQLAEDFDEELTDEDSANLSAIVAKFGLIPKGTDLKETMLKLLGSQIAGFYDPSKKELFLIRKDGDEEPSVEEQMMKQMIGITMEDVYTVHELYHAMQDQYWNLETLPLAGENTDDDTIIAVKGLVEGEATYIMMDFMMGKRGIDIDAQPQVIQQMVSQMTSGASSDPSMADVPAFLSRMLTFPYARGLWFVYKVKQDGGWDAVQKVHTDLPNSSEQILHPEKYIDRDWPQRITLGDMTLPEGWEYIDDNVMGEFGMLEIFRETETREGIKGAEGWDGDTYYAWRHSDGGVNLLWATTWDSENDAKEFFKAYNVVLDKKYDTPAVKKNTDDMIVLAPKDTSEGLVLMHRKGANVLVIEGLRTEGELNDLASQAWGSWKSEEVRDVERVDPERSGDDVAVTAEGTTGKRATVDTGDWTWKGDPHTGVLLVNENYHAVVKIEGQNTPESAEVLVGAETNKLRNRLTVTDLGMPSEVELGAFKGWSTRVIGTTNAIESAMVFRVYSLEVDGDLKALITVAIPEKEFPTAWPEIEKLLGTLESWE